MFHIKISSRIKDHCENQIREFNFAQRGKMDGTKEQQLVGIIGQSAIQDVCGLPLVDGSTGFDGGEDMKIGNYICDIKTMGRTVPVKPSYVNNFVGLQKSYNTDIYIFASLNKTNYILTVCGWIPKGEFFQKASHFEKGDKRTRADGKEIELDEELYEIENKKLRIVINPDHLMNQIYMGWKPKYF